MISTEASPPEEPDDSNVVGPIRPNSFSPQGSSPLGSLRTPSISSDPFVTFSKLVTSECSDLSPAQVSTLWKIYGDDLDGCIRALISSKNDSLALDTPEQVYAAVSVVLSKAIEGQEGDNLLIQIQTSRVLEMIAQESNREGVREFIHQVFEEYGLLFDPTLYRITAQSYQKKTLCDGTHDHLGFVAASNSEGVMYLDEILTVNTVAGFTVSTHAVIRDPKSPTGWKRSDSPMRTEGYEQVISLHNSTDKPFRSVILTGATNSIDEFFVRRRQARLLHDDAIALTLRRAS